MVNVSPQELVKLFVAEAMNHELRGDEPVKDGDGDVTLWIELAGVSYDNPTGSPRSRKKIIEKYCRDGQLLTLGWEENNPHDPDAVSVWATVKPVLGFSKMLKIGYIPRNEKDPIVEHMRLGGAAQTRIYRIKWWHERVYVNVDVVLIGHERLMAGARILPDWADDQQSIHNADNLDADLSRLAIDLREGIRPVRRQKLLAMAGNALLRASTFLARIVIDDALAAARFAAASGRRVSNRLGERRMRVLRTWGPAIVLPTWSLFAILGRPLDVAGVAVVAGVMAAGIWGVRRVLAGNPEK
jgi:hypothetical protein